MSNLVDGQEVVEGFIMDDDEILKSITVDEEMDIEKEL